MTISNHPPTEPSAPPSSSNLPPIPASIRGPANPRISFIITGQGFPTLEQVKEEYMRFILSHHNGHRTRTAKTLGIARETVYRIVGKRR